jgi:hypothetical protein
MARLVRFGSGRVAALAVAVALFAGAALAGCNSPPVTVTPTPNGSGAVTPGPSSSASGSGLPGTPGPSASHTTGGSPTPVGSPLGGDPCRLLTADEVNGALGGGYQVGGAQGVACLFPGDAAVNGSALVSVAVVDGDAVTPIRSRYPDLADVTVSTGTAAWSSSVGTLWLVVDGPKTVIVSILGKDVPDETLTGIALQLAQLAAGRI